MNQEANILEQIDLYLEGKMSLEESAQFEIAINADNELSDMVIRQRLSNQIIVGSRLNNLKVMMDQDFTSGKEKKIKGNWKWWIAGLGVMTGIVLINGGHFKSKEDLVPIKENNSLNKSIIADNSKASPSDNNKDPNERQQVYGGSTKKEKTKIFLKEEGLKDPFSFPEVLKEEPNELKAPLPIVDQKQEFKGLELDNKKTESDITYKPALIREKKVVENKNEVSNIETTVKKSNSHSFKPEFGEVFQIPIEAGAEGEIKIMNRGGTLLYSKKVYGDQINSWDGQNLQGGISAPGLYIYILEFSNGQKESGEIIIY